MLRVAICEDDPFQAEAILELITRYQAIRPDLQVSTHEFGNAEELLDSLESGRVFDMFLLDILMPGKSGIDLARELRLRGEEVPLVFLTSSANYALDAFGVDATQYILKPVKEDSFFPVLDKVASALGKEERRFLLVSTPQRKVKVPFSSIVCVESIGRTLRIHLADGRKLSSKTIRVPFETAVEPLLRDEAFLHAHKSFVLNMAMVSEITPNSFMMKDGTEVPVPRYKYTDAKTRYLGYLSGRGISMVGGEYSQRI